MTVFTKEGCLLDSIILNKKIGETEFWEWQASYIEENEVTTFNYRANPEFLKQVKRTTGEEPIPRTKILPLRITPLMIVKENSNYRGKKPNTVSVVLMGLPLVLKNVSLTIQ